MFCFFISKSKVVFMLHAEEKSDMMSYLSSRNKTFGKNVKENKTSDLLACEQAHVWGLCASGERRESHTYTLTPSAWKRGLWATRFPANFKRVETYNSWRNNIDYGTKIAGSVQLVLVPPTVTSDRETMRRMSCYRWARGTKAASKMDSYQDTWQEYIFFSL